MDSKIIHALLYPQEWQFVDEIQERYELDTVSQALRRVIRIAREAEERTGTAA